MLLRLLGLILFCLINTQGREPYLDDFIMKENLGGSHSDICKLISFKLCIMIDTAEVYLYIGTSFDYFDL